MSDNQLPAAARQWLPALHREMAAAIASRARELRCVVEPGLERVRLLDVSADGSVLVASGGNLLVAWRRGESTPARRWLLDTEPDCLGFARHGSRFWVAITGGQVLLFDPDREGCRSIFRHNSGVRQLCLHSADTHCVFLDEQGGIFRMDLERGEVAELPITLPGEVQITMDATGQHIDVVSEAGVTVYETGSGRAVLQAGYDDDANAGEWEAGRKLLACRGNDLYIWGSESGRLLRVLRIPGSIDAFAQDEAGELFAVAGAMQLHVYRPATYRQRSLFDYTPGVHSLHLRGGDVFFAGSYPSVSSVNAWRGSSVSYADATAPIIDGSLTADTGRLLIADDCSGLSLYDLGSGALLYRQRFRGAGALLSAHQRGEHLAAGSMTGNVYHVDTESGRVRSWSVGSGPVQGIALTDGGLYCGNHRGRIFRIDLATEHVTPVEGPHRANIRKLRLRNERMLAVGECGHVQLLDLATGATINSFRHDGCIYPAVFGSEDGVAFTGDVSGAVIRWDLVRGKRLRRYGGAGYFVRGLFYRDGRIGAVSLDGRVVVWDEASGNKLFETDVQTPQRCRFLCWNEAFTRIMVTGGDGLLHCFDTVSGAEVARGYHTGCGFLWVSLSATGVQWSWTDDPSRLRVHSRRGDEVQELASDDPERSQHLAEINSQTHTMMAVGMSVPEHLAGITGAETRLPGYGEHLLLTDRGPLQG